MNELVRRERIGNVVIWTIDAKDIDANELHATPAARPADVAELSAQLSSLVADAECDPTLRAAVLTGSGAATFVPTSERDRPLRRREPGPARAPRPLSLLARIEALAMPVIAALEGTLLDGGCALALACDLRIAEAHARLSFKQAAIGAEPGFRGLGRLCRAMRPELAAKLLFTSRPLSASEAREVGLVDEVVPTGQGRARALALTQLVDQASSRASSELKQLLRLGFAEPMLDDEAPRPPHARMERSSPFDTFGGRRRSLAAHGYSSD